VTHGVLEKACIGKKKVFVTRRGVGMGLRVFPGKRRGESTESGIWGNPRGGRIRGGRVSGSSSPESSGSGKGKFAEEES